MFEEFREQIKEVNSDKTIMSLIITITIIFMVGFICGIILENIIMICCFGVLFGFSFCMMLIWIFVFIADKKALKKIENEIYKKAELLFSQIEQNKE